MYVCVYMKACTTGPTHTNINTHVCTHIICVYLYGYKQVEQIVIVSTIYSFYGEKTDSRQMEDIKNEPTNCAGRKANSKMRETRKTTVKRERERERAQI